MNIKGNFPTNFAYSGDGGWLGPRSHSVPGTVQVTGMSLTKYDELRVYIDPKFVKANGFLYSDTGFLRALRNELRAMCLNDDVDYSEQGMQEDDYVSFDVGKHFRDSLRGL